MKYGHEIDGIKLDRDCYAEQFAEPGDIRFNYIVTSDGDCVAEDENPQRLAKYLERKAKRLVTIARFLSRLKTHAQQNNVKGD